MDNTETPSLKGFPSNINSKKEAKPVSANRNSDSITLDAQGKTRFTDRITLRCDPETKKAILAFVRQNGLSLCQICDALIKAFLYGIQFQKELGVQSPTINLTIDRVVSKPRRLVYEHSEQDEGLDFYDRNMGDWTKVPKERGINENGHGLGCGCSMCRNAKSL
jgi:hypothetical protein